MEARNIPTCLNAPTQREQAEVPEKRRTKNGRLPEWLMGTGCKPVGYAYLGSNPSAPTISRLCGSGVEHILGKDEASGSNPLTGSI